MSVNNILKFKKKIKETKPNKIQNNKIQKRTLSKINLI